MSYEGYWKGKHLPEEMKKKISEGSKGHPNRNKGGYKLSEEVKAAKCKYKVGDFRIKRGRRLIILEDRSQVLYYRWLMEQKIGRKLLRSEHIHHIDEDPLNDNIDNLMIVTMSEHNTIHKKNKTKT